MKKRSQATSACPRDLRTVFGENVRAARLKLGLTQAQVEKQIGLAGHYLSEIEKGKANVTLVTMQALAKLLGLEAESMLRQRKTEKE